MAPCVSLHYATAERFAKRRIFPLASRLIKRMHGPTLRDAVNFLPKQSAKRVSSRVQRARQSISQCRLRLLPAVLRVRAKIPAKLRAFLAARREQSNRSSVNPSRRCTRNRATSPSGSDERQWPQVFRGNRLHSCVYPGPKLRSCLRGVRQSGRNRRSRELKPLPVAACTSRCRAETPRG